MSLYINMYKKYSNNYLYIIIYIKIELYRNTYMHMWLHNIDKNNQNYDKKLLHSDMSIVVWIIQVLLYFKILFKVLF